MMQATEQELVIPADGRLPEAFRPFFGRKARVVVLLFGDGEETPPSAKRYQTLAVEKRIMLKREKIHSEDMQAGQEIENCLRIENLLK